MVQSILVAKGYHPICSSLILVVLDLYSVRIQAENQPTLRKCKQDYSIKSCKSTLTMFDCSISPLNNIQHLWIPSLRGSSKPAPEQFPSHGLIWGTLKSNGSRRGFPIQNCQWGFSILGLSSHLFFKPSPSLRQKLESGA